MKVSTQVAALLVTVALASDASAQRVCKPAQEKASKEVVALLTEQKRVRFTYDKVFLDPVLWRIADAQREGDPHPPIGDLP